MNANDQCNRCGIDRDVHDLRPAPDHAFVEPPWCPTCLKSGIYTASCEHMKPAPQPSPSGDEAKVRELSWELIDVDDLGTWKDKVFETLTRAYAAGKADGSREANPRCAGCGQIHEPCALCPSGLCSAHQPVEGMVENITRELATAVRFIADNCTSEVAKALVEDMCGYQVVTEAIARRGSEGT